MDHVTMRVEPGTVHACWAKTAPARARWSNAWRASSGGSGSILTDGREQDIANPVVARTLGIGMVYQHFTLAPGMTVAENLLLAGGQVPAVIDWKDQRAALQRFLASTPFSLDLDARPSELAAGEKQKLELLKQLYLKPRLLILDEPTSVLTPQEADEVLGHVREFARSGQCTVLIITHKFREVMAYADNVTVLRRGKAVHHCEVRTPPWPAGRRPWWASRPRVDTAVSRRNAPPAAVVCARRYQKWREWRWSAAGGTCRRWATVAPLALSGISFAVQPGEILGVAGVSRQRPARAGGSPGGPAPAPGRRVSVTVKPMAPGAKRTAG
jgi:ABC-type uncharacterized transport system ATPase subunit